MSRKRSIEKILDVSAQNKPILFSAKTKKGKDDIWKFLENHLSALPKTVLDL